MQMEHTRLHRLNMNLSHSLPIQMKHRTVNVYIVCVTTQRRWRVLVKANEIHSKNIFLILSMFISENGPLYVA